MWQTNSASALGGTHQVFTAQGVMSFFLTPAAPSRSRPRRRVAARPIGRPKVARSSDYGRWAGRCRPVGEVLLNRPLDLDLVGARRQRARLQGGFEALGNEALAHALDRPFANAQSSNDARIGPTWPVVAFVGQQQNAGVR